MIHAINRVTQVAANSRGPVHLVRTDGAAAPFVMIGHEPITVGQRDLDSAARRLQRRRRQNMPP